VEPAVVALAAQNRTKEELIDIRQALEAMEAEHETGVIANYKAKDLNFHMQIAKASHNKILFSICRAIRELLPTTIDKAFVESRKLVSNAMELHRKIFEAIEQKDSVSASAIMEEHLQSVKRLHRKVFK
jgi:GntR family transcriptional regulator, transcriptional repressor for pyruvate dehydrogenase complex